MAPKDKNPAPGRMMGRGPVFRYGLALLSVGLATILSSLAAPIFGPTLSPFVFYYPVVIVAAWYGGLGPGVASVLAGLLAATYFFIEPRGALAIPAKVDLLHLTLFAFVGLVICRLTENLRQTLKKQQRTYQDLLISQNKISNILDSVQGCFFSLDEEDRFTHINEDSKEILPYPREALYGKSVWEAFPGWKDTEFETNLRKAADLKEGSEFEFSDVEKSRSYEIHIAPSSEGVSVHIYDITLRKEAENALSESEARFRMVADQAPVMVWMSGPDALCYYFNEPWLAFRGRTLRQEQGHGWTEGVHPDDRAACVDAYLGAFHAREDFRTEYRLLRADGRYRWVLETGRPRFTSDRRLLGYIGSAIDITDRKVAERRQEMEHKITQFLAKDLSTEELFDGILQTVCEGLGWAFGAYWEVSPEKEEIQCRRVWIRPPATYEPFRSAKMGLTLAPDVGLPGRIWSLGKAFWIHDLSLDPNFPNADLAIQSGLRSGFGFPIRLGDEILGVMEFFENRLEEPDPELLQSLELIGSEIGQYLERKKTEYDLKLAYDEMEKRVQQRTAQMALINETLKAEILERKRVEKEVLEISEKEQKRLGTHLHDDLCQDLTGIMILAKVLTQKMERRELPEAPEMKKIAELLDQSITQARDMARGFYPVELEGDSLMIALKDLASRTSTGYGVDCRFVCPKPILIDDNDLATHLYRIAQEAVRNSVKHGRAKKIDLSLIKQGSMMSLSVEDNGTGGAETQPGSGIGLHIMKYRARMINGVLDIKSGDDGGTVLTCSFSNPTPDSVLRTANPL
ncbi:MAG TPA: PAS domain S-box protein [bacterium]|nr:PAS domain S-box protein [bacterium]